MKNIIPLAHNIRSVHNSGAILRTADSAGLDKVIFSGYSPYPRITNDFRDERIIEKLSKQINKTSLGSEDYLDIEFSDDIFQTISYYRSIGFQIVSLEISDTSNLIIDTKFADNILIILGNEVDGIEESVLKECDNIVHLHQLGVKNSLNVSVAAGIAIYTIKFN